MVFNFLEMNNLRLVRICDNFIRKCDPKYSLKGQTSFTDGYPFLLTAKESLNELNNKLQSPITMHRFRPNIVISGGKPFEEDQWIHIIINIIRFKIVKPCDRCKLPTNNPNTGEFDNNNEPTETLKTFRTAAHLGFTDRAATEVFFGQNMDHEGVNGYISVGDRLIVKSLK